MRERTTRPRVAFATLGCKVNQDDTNTLAELFARRGYRRVPWEEEAEVYVVNTCTVTGIADRKSRQLLRQAARRAPGAVVVATGCYAQTAPEEIARLPEVDLIVGVRERERIVELVEGLHLSPTATAPHSWTRGEEPEARGERWGPSELEPETETEPGKRVRATLKVEDGCAQFCAYCQIPYARGPVRSRPLADAVAAATAMVARGFREIVLTGIHLGAYGEDLRRQGEKVDLVTLVRELAAIPGLARLRLSSLEPMEVTAELLEVMATHPVFCRHLHLPLQSGSASVLQAMRRPYTPDAYREVVRRVRQALPGVALTTDVIVGFPGEGEAEFAETEAFVREMAFSRLHVFPYSARPGTAAATLPAQVPMEQRRERARRLIAVGKELSLRFHQGLREQEVSVLLEEVSPGRGEGLTDTYVRVRVRFPGDWQPAVGEIVPVAVEGATAAYVRGRLVQKNVKKL